MKKIWLLCFTFFPLLAHAEDALQACQKALAAGDYALAAQSGRQAGGFDGAMCEGRARHEQGDYAGATTAFGTAESAAREAFEQMLAITFLARTAQAAGNTDAALGQYARSLKIARQLGQKQAVMVNLNESAQLMQAKGEAKAALERFREAYTFAANDNERSACNQLLAAAYSQLGDHDKAIEHQLKSVMLEERSGDFDHYLNARLELAAIATTAKDFPRARKELEASLGQARNAGSSYWEAKTLFYTGRLEKAQGNTAQSQVMLQQARDLADKIGAQALSGQVAAELRQ